MQKIQLYNLASGLLGLLIVIIAIAIIPLEEVSVEGEVIFLRSNYWFLNQWLLAGILVLCMYILLRCTKHYSQLCKEHFAAQDAAKDESTEPPKE
ncbi:MAG: hypothetical protein WDZ93_01145 [Candidatus Paceibacterota bacterium]